eukprot:TRINITY_DN12617_c0_g1_i1.p1 TRINITY_DN12617_c0_g1~~TRINITY_DN12617_c0_g1_i1.p1  ORF type:complete len:191 (-),score=57.78 TRINITY_DN12617_c0_g1_i1:284-856(-)
MGKNLAESVSSDDEAPEELSLAVVKTRALEQIQLEQTSQNKHSKKKKKKRTKDTQETIPKKQQKTPSNEKIDEEQDDDDDDNEEDEEEMLPDNIINQLQQEKQQIADQQSKYEEEVSRSRLLIAKRKNFDEVDKGVVKVKVLKAETALKPAQNATNFLRETIFGKNKKRSLQMLNEEQHKNGAALVFKKK